MKEWPAAAIKGHARSYDSILRDMRDCLSGMIDGGTAIEVKISDAIVT